MSARKNIMLGTAGHVDHGKTAVVKMLTGCNTDTLAEEQRRGLTIDIGFARCQMADENVLGVIDVPGHVDFIRNMVAGAQGIDVVIFVVAADDSVMPQTREHLDILTLMGARGGIVALTKIDLVQPDMRELVVDDVRGLLAGTFLENAPICPVSNITGEGYDNLLEKLNQAVAACPDRDTSGLFRVWIEDVYAIHGFGTVITGIPVSGQTHVGDRLNILPADRAGRVRKLEVYGQESQVGRAGECVAINLSDVPAEGLGRGVVLCEGESYKAVTMFEAELRLLPHASRSLKDMSLVQLHVGTAESEVAVAMLESKLLDPGQCQMVQLRAARPLPVAPGDRFVIRADLGGATGGHLTTIGGGRVLSTSDIRLRRNRPWTIAALQELQGSLGDRAAWCQANLKQAGKPMSVADMAAAMHWKTAEVEAVLPQMVQAGQAVRAGHQYVHVGQVQALAQRAKDELEKFHAANPHRLGMELADLIAATGSPRELVELAVASLVAQKALAGEGGVLFVPGKGAKISDRDRQVCEQIEAALKTAHLQPPSTTELAAAIGAKEGHVEQMMRLLVDRGVLVRLEERLFMHRDAVAAARQVVIDLFRQAGSFETVAYRDALGVSRKYAVPLLDYFDSVRLTARGGNRRTPGVEARKLLGTV
jgi:selenocysteine-specific elongation factor